MENYNLIIAGVIGSVVTLLITALLDYLKEIYKSNIEIRKLVFQRKSEVVESAVSWMQEAIDCYRMFQSACNELEGNFNQVNVEKIRYSMLHARKLYEESNNRLNRIYLYCNFKDIEDKYNLLESYSYINFALNEINKLCNYEDVINNKGVQEKVITLFKKVSVTVNDQVNALAEIMNKLREEYRKYN